MANNLDQARERLKEQAQASPDYLTVEEAARIARCNPETIRRAFKSGALIATRPAHRVLIREDRLREWIEGRPASEPEYRRPPRRRRSAANGKPSPASAADLREIERNLTRS